MSDIKVGDLVMVVRGRTCGCESSVDGTIFIVSGFEPGNSNYVCGHPSPRELRESARRVEVSRLKKIPPLTEPTETKEEATA